MWTSPPMPLQLLNETPFYLPEPTVSARFCPFFFGYATIISCKAFYNLASSSSLFFLYMFFLFFCPDSIFFYRFFLSWAANNNSVTYPLPDSKVELVSLKLPYYCRFTYLLTLESFLDSMFPEILPRDYLEAASSFPSISLKLLLIVSVIIYEDGLFYLV